MRVLLVEDDPKLGGVLRQGLTEHGFVVDVSADGGIGLERALTTDYDAIVLDLMLPGRGGLEVLRELRQRGRPTPVLVLTARSSVDDRVRGLDLGADDYLAKPFDFRELLARLRSLTRRPPGEPGATLKVENLELDPVGRVVRRRGRRIDLTAKEFSLLEYLMRRRGAVVTRNMILNHVWDLEYEGGSNLVDVYINYLRGKIDKDFRPKLIHTVRGAGYVLRKDE